MRQGDITVHGCNIYIEQILIPLLTKTVHKTDLRIVMKPRLFHGFLITFLS